VPKTLFTAKSLIVTGWTLRFLVEFNSAGIFLSLFFQERGNQKLPFGRGAVSKSNVNETLSFRKTMMGCDAIEILNPEFTL
jgi:hypothetical protein